MRPESSEDDNAKKQHQNRYGPELYYTQRIILPERTVIDETVPISVDHIIHRIHIHEFMECGRKRRYLPEYRCEPESELKENRYNITYIFPENIHRTGDPAKSQGKQDRACQIVNELNPVDVGPESVEQKHNTDKQQQHKMIDQ